MSKAFKCDRCDKFYEPYSEIRKFYIENIDNAKKSDLCPLCYAKFLSWWDAGKEENKNE